MGFFVDFLLCFCFFPFFKMRLFCDKRWSCFVLNLFDFCKKKKFIVQKKNLHLVVLGQETVDYVMRWRRRVFELLSNFLLLFILFGLERIIKAF